MHRSSQPAFSNIPDLVLQATLPATGTDTIFSFLYEETELQRTQRFTKAMAYWGLTLKPCDFCNGKSCIGKDKTLKEAKRIRHRKNHEAHDYYQEWKG